MTALQTKTVPANPSPIQQRKGSVPTVVAPNSGGISIGKKLWNKVCLIEVRRFGFILLGSKCIPFGNTSSSKCNRSC